MAQSLMNSTNLKKKNVFYFFSFPAHPREW